jgi:hypothetical protein
MPVGDRISWSVPYRLYSLPEGIDSIHSRLYSPKCLEIDEAKFMKRILPVAVFGLLLLCPGFPTKACADAQDQTIISRTAKIDGAKLHYMTAGHGTALILLHGYAETSLMWKPIIPVLAERFTVIAPDLPGIGDSDIPADGLDMKNAAVRIHDLAKSLGVQKAEVVGHDIGLMVAYAYAAQFPAEVTKLVLMFGPSISSGN